MFSLVCALSSPTSAEGCPSLFGWFTGTTAQSDFSRNLNVSTLPELHIIAMLISQRIFNTEITMLMIGPVNSNLRLFRLALTWGNDFVYGSGHRGTWLFWNTRSI